MERELIEMAMKLDEALREARTCPTTGLGNARAFKEAHNRLPGKCLLRFDVSNLKAANTALGHAGADRFLVEAAECIRHIRQSFRTGGDEFDVIVSCGIEDAQLLVERIETHFGARALPGTAATVRFIGVAVQVPATCENIPSLLNYADELLESRKLAIKKQAQEPTTREDALRGIQVRS